MTTREGDPSSDCWSHAIVHSHVGRRRGELDAVLVERFGVVDILPALHALRSFEQEILFVCSLFRRDEEGSCGWEIGSAGAGPTPSTVETDLLRDSRESEVLPDLGAVS